MRGSSNIRARSTQIAVVASILLLLVVGAGSVSGLPTEFLINIDADGLVTDANSGTNPNLNLTVAELRVDKTGVPVGDELEVKAIVANYNNKTMEDVQIAPRLYDSSYNHIGSAEYDVNPTRSTTTDLEPGEVRVYNFDIYINDSFSPYPMDMRLILTDEPNLQPNGEFSERNLTVLSNSSSASGTGVIEPNIGSSSTYKPTAFKDSKIDVRTSPLADAQIPPVSTYSDGTVNSEELTEVPNGSIKDISSLLGDGRETTIDSGGDPLNIGFKFGSLPEKEHYKLSLQRSPNRNFDSQGVGDQMVELLLVNEIGEEIDGNTTYAVPPVKPGVVQTNYHLSEEEARHIRNRGSLHVKMVSEQGVEIRGIESILLNGSDALVTSPEPNLNLTSVSVEDLSSPYEAENGDQIVINYNIENEGSGVVNREISLYESGVLNTIRATNNVIINPNTTETVSFAVSADPNGTHKYELNGGSIDTTEVSDQVTVNVGDSDRSIYPSPVLDNSNPIVGKNVDISIDGIFQGDYDRINKIEFGVNGNTYTRNSPISQSDLRIQHSFSESGSNIPVNVQVDYQKDGETVTSEDTILAEVRSKPEPNLESVYYDLSVGSRAENRAGQDWGGGISGTLTSGTCAVECGGGITIGGYSPKSLHGLSMVVFEEDFADANADIVHYSTYNFSSGEYAETDSIQEFENSLDIQSGAVGSFRSNVNEHKNDEGKYLVFVGTGDPIDDSGNVAGKLQQVGANHASKLDGNEPYTFVTKSTDTGTVAMHESYLPTEAERGLSHSIDLQTVKSKDSLPVDQKIYINLDAKSNSNYFSQNDDYTVQYEGAQKENGYATTTVSNQKEVGVNVDLGSDFNTQSDSISLEASTVPSTPKLFVTESAIDTNEKAVVSAASSYDPDGRIADTSYNWNVLEAPDDASYSASGQNFVVTGGQNPGLFEVSLSIDGVQAETESFLVSTGVDAEFKVSRLAGELDYDRSAGSEEILYSFGDEDSVSEYNLQELVRSDGTVNNVEEAFGSGEVTDRQDHIYMEADATNGDSASRYLETDQINLANYDKVYMSYERTFDRTGSGNPETGYVSMHLSDISTDKFTFGNQGTLRGSELDTSMTSDVVTYQSQDTAGNVMELDVSDVNRVDTVKVHARAHGSNNGHTEVKIHEIWADRGTSPNLEQIFSHNFYPDNIEGSSLMGTRSGFMVTEAGSSNTKISLSGITGSTIESRYSISPETNADISLISGGNDIRQDGNYEGEVEFEQAGSNLELTSTNSFGEYMIGDYLSAYVDKGNTQYPTIRLDAGQSAATENAEYSWSVEDATVQDPQSKVTKATFSTPGTDKNIELTVTGRNGDQSTIQKTVDVDPLPPEIEMESPRSSSPGQTVSITVSANGGQNTADVQEVKLLMGNGDVVEVGSTGIIDYTYDNPGKYQITAILKDQYDRTSATSDTIVVDQPTGEILEGSVNEDIILPSNVILDPTGDVARVPSRLRPATIVDISSNVVINDDDLDFRWTVDGQTRETRVLEYTTTSTGTKTITLTAEDSAGRTDNMQIDLNKQASQDIIENVNILQDKVEQYSGNPQVEIELDQSVTSGTTVNITMPDGRTFDAGGAFRDDTESAVVEIGSINTVGANGESTIEVTAENEFGATDFATATVEIEQASPHVDISIDEDVTVTGAVSATHDTYVDEPVDIVLEAYHPNPQESATIEIATEQNTRNRTITIPADSTDDGNTVTRQHNFQFSSNQFDSSDFPITDTMKAYIYDSNGKSDYDTSESIEVHHRGIQIDDFYALDDNGQRTTNYNLGDEVDFVADVTAPDTDENYRFDFWDGGDSGNIDSNVYTHQLTGTNSPSSISEANVTVTDQYGFEATASLDLNIDVRTSCQDINNNRNNPSSGTYWIAPSNANNAFEVYCDMSYSGGGWTMVMAVEDDGSLDYNNNYWTNEQTLNSNDANPFEVQGGSLSNWQGSGNLDGNRKYKSYSTVPADEIRYEMSYPSHSWEYDGSMSSQTAYDMFDGGGGKTNSGDYYVYNHPSIQGGSIHAIGNDPGSAKSGINIGNIRFGYGYDEDGSPWDTHEIGVGLSYDAVEFENDGDDGSGAYRGCHKCGGYSNSDTSAVIWVR